MNFLQQYVHEYLGWNIKDLKISSQELQHGYRTRTRTGYKDKQQIQAYVFTRFPDTYQVCLQLIGEHIKELEINSVLDWGCGIGTASLALSKYFENIEYFLIEQDKQAKDYAAQFIKHFYPKNVIQQDILPEKVDLGVFSYSLGESDNWKKHLDDVWSRTNHLLIVEPGTTAHFQKLLKIRDYLLLKKDAYLVGPCYHSQSCPLKEKDWCHFSVNVPRSKEHKILKNAQRGFEFEAYGYLFFSKTSKMHDEFGRLIASPRIHGGHINLKICTRKGEIIEPTISKSHQDYKQLKKSVWGDGIKNELH